MAKGRKNREKAVASLAAFAVIFLVFYIASVTIIAGILMISYNMGQKEPDNYRLKIYNGSKDKTSEVTEGILNIDNNVYISVEAIDILCPLTVTGTNRQIDLTIRQSCETVTLTDGSAMITVNGISAWLSAPVIFKNDSYYVPVDLVSVYMSGIDAELIATENICKISKGVMVTKVNFVPAKISSLDKIEEFADIGSDEETTATAS